MYKWEVMSTSWGEGLVVRHCMEDDPEWIGATKDDKPFIRYWIKKTLDYEEALKLAEDLNNGIDYKF